jgi:hypothetical protein
MKMQMRMILVALLAAFCMLGSMPNSTAGTYQGSGIYVGTPSPAVTRCFATYRGDGLVACIRQLLINDPALADDVAFVASRSDPDQQSAAADGMAQAFIVLTNRGNIGGAGMIIAAVQLSGNPVLQTAMASAQGSSVGFSASQSFSNPAVVGNGCTPKNNTVSPFSPGTC